jgi:hypothetical protein
MGEQRFRFERDDDGHDYLIPAEKKDEFDKWLEHQGRLWEPGLSDEEFKKRDAEYSGEDFNDYMVDGGPSNYTFTDPKED